LERFGRTSESITLYEPLKKTKTSRHKGRKVNFRGTTFVPYGQPLDRNGTRCKVTVATVPFYMAERIGRISNRETQGRLAAARFPRNLSALHGSGPAL